MLREDEYFEFLRTTGRDPDAIPAVVRSAFADSALLFLGFRMEDWDFRVLFHSIMSQEGEAGATSTPTSPPRSIPRRD